MKISKDILLLLLVFILCFTASTFFYSQIHIDEDEAFYILGGKGLTEGKQLYKDFGEFKTPGTYYVTAAVYSVAGEPVIFQRMLVFFMNILSSTMIFFLGKRIYNRRTGFLAALLYIAAASLPAFTAYFMLAEPFFLFFVITGFYFFFGNGRRNLFMTGMFFGIGFAFKQVAFFPLVAIFIVYAASMYKTREIKTKLTEIFIMAAGFIVPVGIMLLYFSWLGILNDLLYWAILPLAHFAQLFAPDTIGYNFLIFSVVWVFALYFMFVVVHNFIRKKITIKEAILFLWILLAGIPLLRAQIGHNFLALLPAATIMASVSMWHFYEKHKLRQARFFLPLLAVLILSSACAAVYSGNNLYRDGSGFLKLQHEVSDYIAAHTLPGDKIFVFGYQPSFYYLSGRENPTKYPNIIKPYILNDEDFRNLFDQLREANTTYIIKSFRCDHFPLFCNEFLLPEYSYETKIGPFEVYRLNDAKQPE